jgi:RNA polymerase sigma-70 factor (ECF subfamily)
MQPGSQEEAPSGEEQEQPTGTPWALIRRMADPKDHAAWSEFYRLYRRVILSVAFKAGLTHDEAEDATQETMISVFKRFPKFKADPEAGSFRSWLFRLARWRIKNQLKLKAKLAQGQAHASAFRCDDSSRTPTVERVPAPEASHVEALLDDEWRRTAAEVALEKLKQRVKPKHYQVFYLSVIKQQKVATVARALGVSHANVYVLRHRLAKVLQTIVSDLEKRPL